MKPGPYFTQNNNICIYVGILFQYRKPRPMSQVRDIRLCLEMMPDGVMGKIDRFLFLQIRLY